MSTRISDMRLLVEIGMSTEPLWNGSNQLEREIEQGN